MPKARKQRYTKSRLSKYLSQIRKRYFRPKRRSRKQATRFNMPLLYLALCIAVAGFLLIKLSETYNRSLPPSSQNYTVVGKPSISADFINRVLEHYHSPASGKGQSLYDDGLQYGIDPAYALAFFMHESTFGTRGVATVTRSLGNIRATPGHPQYQGYRLYHSWEEGFEDWYRLIANQYVNQWGLATIDQIIPVYAPSSDNNDEALYIHTIKLAVNRWRSGAIEA
ncbi:MAG TPA: glucosaminidase domain-containing protein [Ktedonobacteraceae bacterium]|nr:glucosaminidase domain-containing protein [Ktedonobacteraceae bacterium]